MLPFSFSTLSYILFHTLIIFSPCILFSLPLPPLSNNSQICTVISNQNFTLIWDWLKSSILCSQGYKRFFFYSLFGNFIPTRTPLQDHSDCWFQPHNTSLTHSHLPRPRSNSEPHSFEPDPVCSILNGPATYVFMFLLSLTQLLSSSPYDLTVFYLTVSCTLICLHQIWVNL